MKDVYKQRAYNLINGIESRVTLLEKGVTGAQKVDPNTALRLVQEIKQLNSDVRELVDIS
tara:strand:- start:677 stop:856 length:180 start_codon:yes stop_codon:yes gene_type:complete